MCGFALEIKNKKFKKRFNLIKSADEVQYFRGQDQKGEIFRELGDYYLEMIHHRLAINDLSDAGIQPMYSYNNKLCILFNGEVYNHKYLWKKYISHDSNNACDTRLLVEILSRLGIKDALKKLDWCGSLTIIDFENELIQFVRDSFGEKPMYYYQPDKFSFLISSEIKSILNSLKGKKLSLDISSISCYLRDGVLEKNGDSFFNEIKAFKPGKLYKLDLKKNNLEIWIESFKFFNKSSYKNKFIEGKNNHKNAQKLRLFIKKSVEERLSCDVKTGILFSGGIDSSILASLSNNKIPLFSYMGGDQKDNQSINIYKQIFKPKIFYIENFSEENLIDKFRNLTYILDYPLIGSSLLCFEEIVKCAKREGTKVLLSGQGADELFLGYKKYKIINLLESLKNKLFLKFIKDFFYLLKSGFFVNEFNIKEAKSYIPSKFKKSIFNDNVNQTGKTFSSISSIKILQQEDIYKRSIPVLCHYEDRISMHYGIEMRLPYLSKKVFEYALSVPHNKNLHKGWSKYILRLVGQGIIPKEIQWRKDKKGFTNPETKLINKGPLDWLKKKLIKKKCLTQKYNLLKSEYLHSQIEKVEKSKPFDHNREIFRLIALEIWYEINEKYILSS